MKFLEWTLKNEVLNEVIKKVLGNEIFGNEKNKNEMFGYVALINI